MPANACIQPVFPARPNRRYLRSGGSGLQRTPADPRHRSFLSSVTEPLLVFLPPLFGLARLLLRTILFRRSALRSCLFRLSRSWWVDTLLSCGLTGFLLPTRRCRCYVFRYRDRSRASSLCLCRVLGHNDSTGKFLLPRFYRRRMLGYDELVFLTWPCWCYVFGYHGLIRIFRLCRRHMLRYDDPFCLTWLCRCYVLRHNNLSRLSGLLWWNRPCR